MPPIKTPIIQGGPTIRSIVMRDFTGGLNLRDNALQLAPNESADLNDVDLGAGGGFKRRDSFRKLGSTGLTNTVLPKFMFHWPSASDNGTLLIGGTGSAHDQLVVYTSAQITEGGAPTATRQFANDSTLGQTWSGAIIKPITAAGGPLALYIHRDQNSLVQTYQSDTLLHSELTDSFGAYNDTNAVIGGHCPKASILCAHSTYLFHADINEGGTLFRNRIRWSWAGFPGDYHSDDFIDVGEGQDDDHITAMFSMYGTLFIFKQRSVWMLSGYSASTFSLTRLIEGAGAPNKNAVAASTNGMMFFDQDQGMFEIIYMRGPSGRRMEVAQCIWPKLSAALKDGRITNTANACLTWCGKRLYLSGLITAAAAQPNVTYVMDTIVGQGWFRYGVGFQLLAEWADSNNLRRIAGASPYSSDATAHKDRVVIQGLTAGTLPDDLGGGTLNYAGYLATSWMTGGDPSLKKRFRRLSLVFDNMIPASPLTVNAYRNWNTAINSRTFSVAGTGAGSGDLVGTEINVRAGTVGAAYSVALRITGPNDQAWNVNQITARYVPLRIV